MALSHKSPMRSLTFRAWLTVTLLSLIAIAAVFAYFQNSSARLFQDLFSLARLPVYFGLFSNLGVFCWCVAAAICLFSAAVILPVQRNSALAAFLLFSGLITLWLAVDDFFMLHEYLIPKKLGIPEEIIFAAYSLVAGLFTFRFRKVFLRTNLVLLSIALILLGASVGIDKLFEQLPFLPAAVVVQQDLIEDGFKFLGIVTWLFYFIDTSLAAVNSLIFAASNSDADNSGTNQERCEKTQSY